MIGIGLAEAGFLPDWIIRLGIRSMLRDRLRGLEQPDPEAAQLDIRGLPRRASAEPGGGNAGARERAALRGRP